MIYKIETTKEEKDIIEKFANNKNIFPEEAFKTALFDRIEDENDKKVFMQFETEKAKGNIKTYSHEEVWKILDL